MKLSVSAYRAHASAHKKILSSGYHSQLNYGSTGAGASASSSGAAAGLYAIETNETSTIAFNKNMKKTTECNNSDTDMLSPTGTSSSGQEPIRPESKHRSTHRNKRDKDANGNTHSSDSKSPSQRKSNIGDGASDPDSDWTRSNQRWMKLRTTVQISSAIQKKPPLKREDSFLKRFSTRHVPEAQETVEDTGSESASGDADKTVKKRRRRYLQKRRSVVNPDENFYFYWLMVVTICVLYNLWTLIVRQSFPELQNAVPIFWFICDSVTDVVFIFDIIVQLRTGYLEQGLMVYDDKKLATHYIHSRACVFDFISLIPFDLLQLKMGFQPLLRFTRFFKVYRSVRFYYIVESRTVWPNLWRVVNLIHILLILAHWFGCFYFLLSEAEGFQGDWVYPYRPGDYATLTRKYLGSLYWSTLTLTTIGDLPTPETNAEYIFTIVSYLIGVFIFATIVGQVGNVITNRNANRLEFERLLDGAKTYMRHHKVPGGMKRRVLRWYDYSWSRGRIQGGGDINTALGLLPDKLKTELALHVNLSVLKKVTIFQECQPEFLHDLVLKMKAYIFTPGDSICRKGEVAREMFIIADGILEVCSETGKVLTTMKAGDFFGEIGILNLDGLNKRTADVRSVGYSELFSLSREDVLAAMKDYPEAQEILQTLGRKRLMEVRCVNKRHAKAQAEKDALNSQSHHNHPSHHSHVNQSDSSENSASKKIVDKLKHDVKGFRSVLKKTRTSRRSDESLEMQPLHNTSPKNGKTVLKRMSRVRSDDKEETPEEKEELHDNSPSPIGAGLPLLQRLRLLKEKQDREERAVKSTQPPQKSPPHSHVTCTLSPQESIQEEPEREINEGLPLIQRLQQLKIKNDPPPPSTSSTISSATVSNLNISITSPSAVIPNISSSLAMATTSAASNSADSTSVPLLAVASLTKPIMKVSFKQRLQQLQAGKSAEASPKVTAAAVHSGCSGDATVAHSVKKEPPKTLAMVKPAKPNGCKKDERSNNDHQKRKTNISKHTEKPSTTTPPLSVSMSDADTPIKPWSKLKLATLISSSYTSLATSNTSPEDLQQADVRKYSLGSIPQHIMDETPVVIGSRRKSDIVKDRRTAGAKAAKPTSDKSKTKHLHPEIIIENKNKFYQSVFDLSPEYNGLPFVKRLKILNERQKLAELEKALQTRSFSLDSSKTTSSIPIAEVLYRSRSDTSGINSQFLTAYESDSTTTSTNTSTSENLKCSQLQQHHTTKYMQHHQDHRLDSVQHDYTPLSPESNETIERRKLKSILKKFNRERDMRSASTSSNGTELTEMAAAATDVLATSTRSAFAFDSSSSSSRGLSMEPTVEGPPGSVINIDARCTTTDNNDGGLGNGRGSSIQSTTTIQNTTAYYASVMPPAATAAGAAALPPLLPPPPISISIPASLQPTETRAAGAALLRPQTLASSNGSSHSFQMNSSLKMFPPQHPPDHPSFPSSDSYRLSESNQNSFNRRACKYAARESSAEGFSEGTQDYFNHILIGINNAIRGHMNEMHSKFESQFSTLAMEVKRRDAIIDRLQSKLRTMELSASAAASRRKVHREKLCANKRSTDGDDEEPNMDDDDDSSSDSSAELLFMRGDSLDTVFTSSPPTSGTRTKRHCNCSPNTGRHREDCAAETARYYRPGSACRSGKNGKARTAAASQSVSVSNLTGNLTRLGESVILDIGDSSSSSSASDKFIVTHAADVTSDRDDRKHVGQNDDEDDDDDEEAEGGQHNDWEVRMLAAEMEKQERKRGLSLSSSDTTRLPSELLLRRRRKFSDTETEYSETDLERTSSAPISTAFSGRRPRASSLDQFNLRYGIGRSGMFKAMSIDRDKDKL